MKTRSGRSLNCTVVDWNQIENSPKGNVRAKGHDWSLIRNDFQSTLIDIFIKLYFYVDFRTKTMT